MNLEIDLDYYAFGMLLPGRNYNSNSYRFGFNGQEKDDEITGSTGSHYTATFWEYDTRTGRRWNLDPEPTIGISDYACFGDNPILYIDPLGNLKDNYSVDVQGNVKLEEKTDDKVDVLYTKESWDSGKKDNSITVDKGILGSSKTNTKTAINKKTYTFDQYETKGDDKSKDLFEFVAKNTSVEWSLTGVGKEAEGKNILTTSHLEGSDIGGGYLLAYGYSIRSHVHSHPYNKNPSPADKHFAGSLNSKFSKVTPEIFYKGNYFEYNKNGRLQVPVLSLPEVEIKAPK